MVGVLATEALRGAIEQRDLAKLRVAIAQEREADEGVIEVGFTSTVGGYPTTNFQSRTPSHNHYCHPKRWYLPHTDCQRHST